MFTRGGDACIFNHTNNGQEKRMQFSIGKAVKKACIDADIKHRDMAHSIGVTPIHFSRMVRGDHIGTDKVLQISEVLGMKPSELVAMAESKS
jgi:plasmid maintenance system antidote protein VapI